MWRDECCAFIAQGGTRESRKTNFSRTDECVLADTSPSRTDERKFADTIPPRTDERKFADTNSPRETAEKSQRRRGAGGFPPAQGFPARNVCRKIYALPRAALGTKVSCHSRALRSNRLASPTRASKPARGRLRRPLTYTSRATPHKIFRPITRDVSSYRQLPLARLALTQTFQFYARVQACAF